MTRPTPLALAAAVLAAALAACSRPAAAPPAAGAAAAPSASAAAPNASPAAVPAASPDAQGWIVLFDGTPASLAANWRGYKKDAVPTGWRAEDGALGFTPGGGPETHGDLATREQFGDFELTYSWRVAPGANSGVMWRVSEDQAFPYQTGPEQQVLDDERHPDGKIPTHRAGALYDFVVPPAGLTRPVGEFNAARVVARGQRVQLFLNGRPTADVDFASDTGRRLLAASKFKAMAGFARNARGHIVLQDHGDRVWFRDVRVRRLDGAAAPAAP